MLANKPASSWHLRSEDPYRGHWLVEGRIGKETPVILNGAECFWMKQFKGLLLSASTVPTTEKHVNSPPQNIPLKEETISFEVANSSPRNMNILDCLSGEKSRTSWELHGEGRKRKRKNGCLRIQLVASPRRADSRQGWVELRKSLSSGVWPLMSCSCSSAQIYSPAHVGGPT